MEGVRINKFLSEAGICSRREGDRLISEGRVMLDERTAAAGDRVLPGQKVTVDGRQVVKEEEEKGLRAGKSLGDSSYL